MVTPSPPPPPERRRPPVSFHGGRTLPRSPRPRSPHRLHPPAPRNPSAQHRTLAHSVATAMPGVVDELHLAASLESRGITDDDARDAYGSPDVFHLAKVLFRDVANQAVPREPADRKKPVQGWRVLAHGPLYALPSATYPAAFTLLGAESMVRGMVFGTALGWVWGMAMSAVAYQLRGQSRERAAARALRYFCAVGLGVALLGAVVLARTGSGGIGLPAFVLGQMAFQLTSGVLVFYGKELWLALLMAPAFVVGMAHVATGFDPALVSAALAAAGVSVTLICGAAWFTAVRGAADAEPDAPGRVVWGRLAVGAAPSVCYGALGALFLLFTDARFVIGQLDLAIAVAPLVLGMGAVEWRAARFTEQAEDALRREAGLPAFRRCTQRLVVRELTLCLLVLGGLAAALAAVLGGLGLLSGAGVVLIEGHVVLGGGYFLGFVLARHEQFPAVIGIMAAVVTADVAAVLLLTADLGPGAPIAIFLANATALLVALLARLWLTAGRIYHYR